MHDIYDITLVCADQSVAKFSRHIQFIHFERDLFTIKVNFNGILALLGLCTYQWYPPLPHSWVGWGDLTEYHVKNPSPGALPDVNTPIYRQESIGDLT